MAEGVTNHFFGDKLEAFSAGSQASYVHPLAIEVMKEIDIDISDHRSKNLSEFNGQKFDYVITLCGSANETCLLYFSGTKKIHIGFDDPAKATGSKEEIIQKLRRMRDEIKDKLTDFFQNIILIN